MPLHSDLLLDHFQHPRNAGRLLPPAVSVEVSNPACGDVLRLSVRIENDLVVQAGYEVRGCTASIAAGSALTEWMQGKTTNELLSLKPSTIEAALGGLQPASKHAAVLCADAARAMAESLLPRK